MKKRFLYLIMGITSFSTLLISCGNNGSTSKNYHVVTFDTHGGSQVPSQNVEHGNKAYKPDDPDKPGYEFITWTYKGEEWSFIGYSVTEDITLDAKWSAITYSIEYNLDGGTNNPSNPGTYTADDEYNLYSPTKEGYSFAGWTLNGEQISKISKGTFGNLILTATFVSFEELGISFALNDDNQSYTLDKYKSSFTYVREIIIPSCYKGLVVTSIGRGAFYNCSSLTSITIPDSVTFIGDYAFSICSSLTSITIPDSVTSIGDYAFFGCSSLTSITIPDSVLFIGRDAFSCCSRLTSITLPDSVTSIGDYAFQYCSSLTSITLLDSVTSIGDCAFQYCSSLTSISIPDSVISIGDFAFSDCSSLTSITIPDSVISIGAGAFSGCSSLTSITIPECVTCIGDFAFSNCSSLKSITIPDSVTTIGADAFSNCSSLKSITIPDSVSEIGTSAFIGCPMLSIVYYGGNSGTEWSSIAIGTDNDYLKKAAIYYYSEEEPTEAGNYWHYVDGVPTEW